MLAYCNVTYDSNHSKPNVFVGLMLRAFVKKKRGCGQKSYKKNRRAALVFLTNDVRDFEKEKKSSLIIFKKTQQLGEVHCDNN
jgi:hypothetical protein